MTYLRFGIRDLLWAMVVMGLAIGWWLDHSNQTTSFRRLKAEHEPLAKFFNDHIEYARLRRGGWQYVEKVPAHRCELLERRLDEVDPGWRDDKVFNAKLDVPSWVHLED